MMNANIDINPIVRFLFSSPKMEFKMYSSVKKPYGILFFTLVIFIILNFCWPTLAKSVGSDSQNKKTATSTEEKTNTESQSGSPVTKTPKEPDKIEQVGEKVGQQIDNMTQQTSSRIGSWINAKVFFGITWFKLIICFFLLFVVLLIERIVRLTIDRKRKKAEQEDVKKIQQLILSALAKPLTLFIWVYGVYIVLTPLFVHFQKPDGTNLVHTVAQKAADLGAAIALFWFIFKLVSVVDFHLKKWAASTDSSINDVLAPLFGKTLRVFIVIIGGILILQNLTGVKIGPLLASLGIGGIAIALAAKDSIANFFGTLTILFDKPFQVGERVIIDNYDGVVEDVGFRSTRIRTLNGHLVTIPNEKVVNSGLENIGKRPHIRWLTNITITYDTPPDRVEKAISIIKEILDNHEGSHPDFPPRVYFNGFNDWSLNIMVIAWYHPANYWDMQEWLQRTCLEILKRFNDEGIDFAFPSRTLYLANDDKRQLKLKMLQGETATYIPEGESHE
jgi:MscS family membrane protein